MSESMEQALERIRLNLTGYQSELNAIDVETTQEKERILSAIKAEEAEIKSLLDEYRNIKRQKEVEVVRSSYNYLSDFKQNLLLKIQSEAGSANNQQGPVTVLQANNFSSTSVEGGGAKKTHLQPDNSEQKVVEVGYKDEEQDTNKNKKNLDRQVKDNKNPDGHDKDSVVQLIEFIDRTPAQELVRLYPADISHIVPKFNVNDTVVRDKLLQHYQQRNRNTYNSLLKLYQKPDLGQQVAIPNLDELTLEDRKYHEFLRVNYPSALPFFWFLINREPDSIRYVVMEFAVDHIIQTNTLEKDNNRELTISLEELLRMNNKADVSNFLRDLFVCFHPKRVSQKSNSKNKYFDYVTNLIKTQSTLQHSDILRLWNHMTESGYYAVSSADFVLNQSSKNSGNGHDKSIAPNSQHDIL